jgi:hypothetical protein
VPRSHACMRSWAPRAKTTIRTQAAESVIGQPKSQNGHAGLVSVCPTYCTRSRHAQCAHDRWLDGLGHGIERRGGGIVSGEED